MKEKGTAVRRFQDGPLSVVVYRNTVGARVFYDVVIYRRIRVNGDFSYRRGTNLKPEDLPSLQRLLHSAEEFMGQLEP